MTDSQEQLDALVSDIAQCADVSKDVVVALVAVGVASVDRHIAMPVPTVKIRNRLL